MAPGDIPAWAPDDILDEEPADTFDEALGDILVWELADKPDGEHCGILAWAPGGKIVLALVDILDEESLCTLV